MTWTTNNKIAKNEISPIMKQNSTITKNEIHNKKDKIFGEPFKEKKKAVMDDFKKWV